MPRVIGFWKIFCCRPRVCKVFLFVALRWAPRPFGGARAKKKHHPGRLFFFAPAPGKGRGRRSPVPARGQSKKKHHPGCVFFCCGPGVFFFLLWPRAGAQRGFSFPCLSPGPEQKKKHPGWSCFLLWPGWCFFFALAPPKGRGAQRSATKKKTHFAHPGPTAKNFLETNDAGRADAHSLTAGLGGDASPSPGWCFFFLLRPCPDRWCFFLLWPRPDAHSLTVGWGDFGKARVVFFFLLRPRRVFLDNNKNCLGYYIGCKRTRRGHSKKTTPLPVVVESKLS